MAEGQHQGQHCFAHDREIRRPSAGLVAIISILGSVCHPASVQARGRSHGSLSPTTASSRDTQDNRQLNTLGDTYGFPGPHMGSGLGSSTSGVTGHHLRPTYPPISSTTPLLEGTSSRTPSFDRPRSRDADVDAASFLAREPEVRRRKPGTSQRRRDWKVWPIYVREATERDRGLEKGWDDDMDVLLIFAGLFSAVVTAFLVQEYQQLQPSYPQLTAQLLYNMITNGTGDGQSLASLDPSNYSASVQPSDVTVNALWFAALTFSVAAALLAMLGKIWIRQISSGLASVPYDRARQQQFRWNGIRRFKLGAVLNSLTLLLHISAFLFFAGLLLFLQNLNSTIFSVVTALFVISMTAYVGVTFLPLISPDAPFKIPLIDVLRALRIGGRKTKRSDNLRMRELKQIETKKGVVDAQAIAWLLETSETLASKDALNASMEIIADVLSGTKVEREAMFREGVLSVMYRLFLDADEDEDDPNEVVQILKAIELLWHDSDSKAGQNLRRRAVPNDDLHNGFFERVVQVLETSSNIQILDAAIQLPKQFKGWPIAEWPIASRISIPAIMKQMDKGRFDNPASKEAALDVVCRVFSMMRNTHTNRHVNEQDLINSIPVISRVIQTTESIEILRSVLQVVDEVDGVLYRSAPTGWVREHLSLYLDDDCGLLKALLHLLGRRTIPDDTRVRYLLCRLVCHPEIGEACRDWLVAKGGIPTIVADIRDYKAPANTPPDHFVLLLIDSMTAGGYFTSHPDLFIDADLLEALAKYFERNIPAYDPIILSGLLRRLLRLASEGTPQQVERLKQSLLIERMLNRFSFRHPYQASNTDAEFVRLVNLARTYPLGSLPPGQIPPVQPRGTMAPPELPPLVRVSSERSD